MFPFDPSKMDPRLLAELSELIRQLPPDQLSRMQTLMHNMMAGFNVQKEMEEFEKSLPPGFREKLLRLMAGQAMATPNLEKPAPDAVLTPSPEMNLRDARLTILRAVAAGNISPEEAEKLLFKD